MDSELLFVSKHTSWSSSYVFSPVTLKVKLFENMNYKREINRVKLEQNNRLSFYFLRTN